MGWSLLFVFGACWKEKDEGESCWYLNLVFCSKHAVVPMRFPRQFSNWMDQIVQNQKKKETNFFAAS